MRICFKRCELTHNSFEICQGNSELIVVIAIHQDLDEEQFWKYNKIESSNSAHSRTVL